MTPVPAPSGESGFQARYWFLATCCADPALFVTRWLRDLKIIPRISRAPALPARFGKQRALPALVPLPFAVLAVVEQFLNSP